MSRMLVYIQIKAAAMATRVADISEEAIMAVLDKVPDPEIPAVSITDLGIVRSVSLDPPRVRITPTYSGCPATRQIEHDIRAALARAPEAAAAGDGLPAPVLPSGVDVLPSPPQATSTGRIVASRQAPTQRDTFVIPMSLSRGEPDAPPPRHQDQEQAGGEQDRGTRGVRDAGGAGHRQPTGAPTTARIARARITRARIATTG